MILLLSVPLEIKPQVPLNHYASSSLTETLQNPKNIPLVPAAVLPRDRLIGNNVAFSFANPPVNKKYSLFSRYEVLHVNEKIDMDRIRFFIHITLRSKNR